MIITRYFHKFVFVAFITGSILISSCGENGGFLGLGGDNDDNPIELTGVPCRPGNQCPNASECDENRRCNCPDPSREIRPGFCYFADMENVFITTDRIHDVVDTMVLGFDEDPVSLLATSPLGSRIALSGQFVTSGSTGWSNGGVASAYRSSTGGGGQDSIIITSLPSGGVDGYIWPNGYRCQTWFYGTFINGDTIQGELRFVSCTDFEPGATRPLGADSTHVMTWIRQR